MKVIWGCICIHIYVCLGDYVGIMNEKRKLLLRISGLGLGL